MADYVEKFKASDPFNMEGFNAKIDQINTSVEKAGGVKLENVYTYSSGAHITNIDISNYTNAKLFLLVIQGNQGDFANFIVPNILLNTIITVPYYKRTGSDSGDWKITGLAYKINNNSTFEVLWTIDPNASYVSQSGFVVTNLYAIM